MVETQIPRWIAALDERKPYIEVLDGKKLPDEIPYSIRGQLVARIGAQLDEGGGGRCCVGRSVRFYFLHANGRWTSLLPDVEYASYARVPRGMADTSQRPRVAPDIAVEILSPGARPERTQRKVDTYLEFGAALVLVLHPMTRAVRLHHAGRSVEERDARGAL